MDVPYSNRELKEMFKAADERADSFHEKLMERMDTFEEKTGATLTRIETQTIKTNGSVAEINKWRERMNGMGVATGIFMTMIVMPILIWSVYVLVNIKETVHQSIDDALQAYEITNENN